MGLKNKNSLFDLIAGNNPVEDMASQIGPTSQLPTDVASQAHIDSLQVVPGGTQNSPFQDLLLHLSGLPFFFSFEPMWLPCLFFSQVDKIISFLSPMNQ